MKINVIRNLILPWFAFFMIVIAGIVIGGVKFPAYMREAEVYYGVIAVGILVCLIANMRTLSKAGIWIAHSLPSSLRYNSRPWILAAVKAALIALAFYLVGQMTWIPLMWQGFIIPIVFTVSLFVGVWGLMGPILTWSSKISFSRLVAFFVALPVFALVPLTAMFLGQTILTAYLASRPELFEIASAVPVATEKEVAETAQPAKKETSSEVEKRAESFRALAEGGKPCYEETKEVSAALTHNGPEDVVYWAVKAVKCTDMKSVVALPKLVKIMTDHSSPKVRAAAIKAMPRFGSENVKRVAYLLVKRINENESYEVIQATASVLSKLGEEETKYAVNRLKALLDTPKASTIAAKVLIQDLKREDLVTDYVSEHLAAQADSRGRAVSMICLLPKNSRSVAEPQIAQVVASIKTGSEEDPAMEALDCLGHPGFQAIRQEVIQPQHLQRPVAARALAEMDVKSKPEALETAEQCVRDADQEVRKWCSQSLGKIGAPALPKILDLLKSNESDLKEAGRNALNFFDDPGAKAELEKVRADNSGWMANKKKLQIAEAVNTALMKIETEERKPASPESTESVEK